MTHRTGRTWPRYSRLRSTTLCQHVEKWEPGAQLSSCHYTRLDFKVELWACVRNTCFKFQARLAWHISCAFIQLYCMNSATRWYYWLTFFFFFTFMWSQPSKANHLDYWSFALYNNSLGFLHVTHAFTISDQTSLSSVACPIQASETQWLAGRCWSSWWPQLRELHWAFLPASAWLCRPAGRWHQAAGASPNYNYQLQLQMETSRRDGPCILCGLHQPPQSALKSLNRPAARTNHHTLHQLLKCLWASCRLNTV